MKYFKSPKSLSILALGVLSLRTGTSPAAAAAAETAFDYFGSDINYWPSALAPGPISSPANPVPREADGKSSAVAPPFDWDKFTNPKNREFFKEGDYTPPEPFMEIVRRPTDENLTRWFAYIEKRNELSRR